MHDLSDNLLQVSLLLKQVIDDLQEGLKTINRKNTAIIPNNLNDMLF